MRSLARIGGASLAGLLFAGLASAQFNFQLTVTQQGNAVVIQNGANLSFSDPVGQSETVRVTAIYLGGGQVSISQGPQIFGSNAFTVSFPSKLPLSITNGGNFYFDVTFRPASPAQTNAQLNLPYAETLTGPAPTFTPVTSQGLITLGLQGASPSIVLSYILQADLNVVSVAPNGTVMFPPTQINSSSQASFNISNRGSGAAQVDAISSTGSAFKISGLPLFPVSIGAGQNLQILIQYQPTQVATDTGQIQITVDPSTTLTVNLQGKGTSTSSALAYQIVNGTSVTPVSPGDTISAFPDTNVGQSASLTIQVTNTGNAAGTINSINLSGGGNFGITDGPALPLALAVNASFSFTIAFAPQKPGTLTGRLTVGTDPFNLSAVGLGSNLTFSYTLADTVIPVPSGGAVVFSPVMISKSAQLDFDVSNTGTLPAAIANIGIAESSGPFALSGLPALPVTIAPNTDLHFTISFTPTTTGFSNGTLRLDTNSIVLSGSGTAPPPLPSYTIQGPSGNIDPQTQPGVSLKLASPYPLDLAGALTMTISTDLVPDPAAQFSSGGRTVQFTIPANATDAVFAGQGTQIRMQPGTVAGTITLTPSFATQAGAVNVTPNSPVTLQFGVAAEAPVLIAGGVANVTSNAFTLTLSGFSTTRALSTLTVQFTPVAGYSVPQTQFTIDLRQSSTVWFQGGGSQNFGGQFVVSAPFEFQGTVPAGQSLLQSVSALSATVSNASGTSNAMQAAIH